MRPALTLLIIVLAIATAGAQPVPYTNDEIAKLEETLRKQEAASDYPAQEKTIRKLIVAQSKLSGADSVYTWRRQQSLLSVLQRGPDQKPALELLATMLATAERLHGKESNEVREVLGWMTQSYDIARTFDEGAEPLFRRMLAISKKVNGEKSTLYGFDLARYGNYLMNRSEFVAAARVHEQVLAIEEAAKANTAGTLSTLGMLYMHSDIPRAKKTFDRYIAVTLKTQAVAQQMTTIWWCSGFFRRAGRLDLAAPLEKQALDMARKEILRVEAANGKDAQELSWPLFTLGNMLMEIGDLTAADPVLVRIVALEEKLKSPFVSYAQLATLRRKQGRAKDALALFEKAQKQMQGGTGLYSMMGDIHRELGDTKTAEKLYLAAMADLDKNFGKNQIFVVRLHLGLCAVYVAAKQLDKAERVLAENLDIAERELSFVLASGTETDHLAYFVRESYLLDSTIALHARNPKRASAARLAMTTILRRKGRILDAAAQALGKLRARLPAEDRKLFAELEAARAQLGKIVLQGPQANPNFAKQVAALEEQIQRLEVTLARKNAELKIALQPVQLADVQKKLPKDAKLVEIVNYQPGDITAPFSANPVKAPRRYIAYVLGDRGDPTLIDLGEAKPIDDAIVKLRAAFADPDNDSATEQAKAMHALTFAKLAPALGKAKQILIAPDGALNVVPFAALHDGKQFLVENYTFTYLSSGRDLLRLGVRPASKQKPRAVIFADPDFDNAPAPQPAGRRSRAMQNLSWPALPGTAAEADALEKALASPTVYRKKQATETTLKSLKVPGILHLATHGFFLSDADASVENPLLRSGLVFAGANGLSSGNDDGVVTALEAAGLDLRGTRLVVLSACETGVGKVTNGDGVYGLRRALVIAGAESLVMSMWEVDDVATKDLMVGYYKKLASGEGRSEALRSIQRELHAKPKYAHPFYWASFVAAGDSSPL